MLGCETPDLIVLDFVYKPSPDEQEDPHSDFCVHRDHLHHGVGDITILVAFRKRLISKHALNKIAEPGSNLPWPTAVFTLAAADRKQNQQIAENNSTCTQKFGGLVPAEENFTSELAPGNSGDFVGPIAQLLQVSTCSECAREL